MSGTSKSSKWDDVYFNRRDVWTIKDFLPKFLEEAKQGALKEFYQRCNAARTQVSPFDFNILSLGCGEGFYEQILAEEGYTVRAVDVSEVAIERARKRTAKMPNQPKYEAVDWLNVPEQLIWPCQNLVFDWTMFHHLNPRTSQGYKNIVHGEYKARVLKAMHPYGSYVLCHASDSDDWFANGQKVATGDSGLPIYRNRPEEIMRLFAPDLRLVRFQTAKWGDMFPSDALKGKPKEALERKFDQYLFRRR